MKENEKILISKSILKVTFIMMSISLLLKLLGLNVMKAEVNSNVLLFVSNILLNIKIEIVYAFILLFIQQFILFKLCCFNKSTKIYYIASLIFSIITLIFQYIIYNSKLSEQILIWSYFIFTFLLSIIFVLIIDYKVKYDYKNIRNKILNILHLIYDRIKRPILWLIILSLYQLLAMFLRNITFIQTYEVMYDFLLNFDYIILLLITYYLFSRRNNDVKILSMFDFKLPKIFNNIPSINNVKLILSDFKDKISKLKIMDKQEKLVFIIYIILFIISELFNLSLVIFIASMNNVLIECLFIISAFLITRNTFGAFHFDAVWKCWIVSNISFFILNKLTLSVGFTILIPIIFGIALAFITSKFIKNTITAPYRGMSKQELQVLCKNKNLSEFENNLLIDFYCNRDSISKLTYKYNYSQTAIVRFKKIALNKINKHSKK